MGKEKLLVIGANGQIGTVLTDTLRAIHGDSNVIASDIQSRENQVGPFELLDILDADRLSEIVQQHQITQIYHLAAILSAAGEKNPRRTWNINMNGLFNVLEVAKVHALRKVFFPSSIAVFGQATPRFDTPQHTVLDPATIYGISKAAGENWCQYYFEKYDLDVRSLRYPGVISYQSLPGGGTTDYAVDIFHKAVQGLDYECFLKKDTMLPMIYMEDAIRATCLLMEAPAQAIKIRTSYNLAAMSFTPEDIFNAIRQHLPDFQITYQPDYRQAIADSWTATIDDSAARTDWGWEENYDLVSMTADMISQLTLRYEQKEWKIEN
ncbi:MAG: NAD-dependent epimerase/dehydratase family protein [Bacteroidota bacterium]